MIAHKKAIIKLEKERSYYYYIFLKLAKNPNVIIHNKEGSEKTASKQDVKYWHGSTAFSISFDK